MTHISDKRSAPAGKSPSGALFYVRDCPHRACAMRLLMVCVASSRFCRAEWV